MVIIIAGVVILGLESFIGFFHLKCCLWVAPFLGFFVGPWVVSHFIGSELGTWSIECHVETWPFGAQGEAASVVLRSVVAFVGLVG